MSNGRKFVVNGRLPNLNEYTRACRSNAYAGNTMKKQAEEKVILSILRDIGRWKTSNMVYISFLWIEQNTRRDLDNIAFAKKFILDALVKSGTIKNDGWKNILGFKDDFAVDKNRPRIEVVIKEVVSNDK